MPPRTPCCSGSAGPTSSSCSRSTRRLRPYLEKILSQTSVVNFLRLATFLGSVPPRQILAVLDGLEECTFPSGDTILRQGDPGDRLYIIRSGEVKVTLGQNGKETVLNYLVEGAGFGEPPPAGSAAQCQCHRRQGHGLLQPEPAEFRPLTHPGSRPAPAGWPSGSSSTRPAPGGRSNSAFGQPSAPARGAAVAADRSRRSYVPCPAGSWPHRCRDAAGLRVVPQIPLAAAAGCHGLRRGVPGDDRPLLRCAAVGWAAAGDRARSAGKPPAFITWPWLRRPSASLAGRQDRLRPPGGFDPTGRGSLEGLPLPRSL